MIILYIYIYKIYIFCKVARTLVNQYIYYLMHLPLLFFVRTFKFYSLSQFQLQNTVLSTVVTMFYIKHVRSSDLIHHIAASLYLGKRENWKIYQKDIIRLVEWKEDCGELLTRIFHMKNIVSCSRCVSSSQQFRGLSHQI